MSGCSRRFCYSAEETVEPAAQDGNRFGQTACGDCVLGQAKNGGGGQQQERERFQSS